jgi:hypothetical protein
MFKKLAVSTALGVVIMLGFEPSGDASTPVLTDGFESATVSGTGRTSTATSASTWKNSASADTTFSIETTNPLDGTKSLHFGPVTNSENAYTTFTQTTLAAGETLVVTFDLRWSTQPDNINSGFGFGVFNAAASQPGAWNSSNSTSETSPGYGWVQNASSGSGQFFYEAGTVGLPLRGADRKAIPALMGVQNAFTAGNKCTVTLKITNTGTQTKLSLVIVDDVSGDTLEDRQTTDTNANLATFNTLVFATASTKMPEFDLDNLSIQVEKEDASGDSK